MDRIEIMDNGEAADAKMTLAVREGGLVVETNSDNFPVEVTTAEALACILQEMAGIECQDLPSSHFHVPAEMAALRILVVRAYPDAEGWDWCSESAS